MSSINLKGWSTLGSLQWLKGWKDRLFARKSSTTVSPNFTRINTCIFQTVLGECKTQVKRSDGINDDDDKHVVVAQALIKARAKVDDLDVCSAEDIVRDLLEYVRSEHDAADTKTTEMILHEALDIAASHKVNNRTLIRDLLKRMFAQRNCIEREVLLFEYADDEKDVVLSMDKKCKAKREYVLDQISGWRIDSSEEPWSNCPGINYYIDLPFERITRNMNSQLMAEALYRLQDPDLVLSLLRHGANASCIYLWPVSIMLDLKSMDLQGTTEDGFLSAAELAETNEAKMFTYFCRARHHMRLHFVAGDDSQKPCLPSKEHYDNILLLPPHTESLIPQERYKVPASLQQHCRLAIRNSLMDADSLPRGIDALPLPSCLKKSIDLLED